jgi:hypothetical protein
MKHFNKFRKSRPTTAYASKISSSNQDLYSIGSKQLKSPMKNLKSSYNSKKGISGVVSQKSFRE